MMVFLEHSVGLNLVRLFGCKQFHVFVFFSLSILLIGTCATVVAGLLAAGLIAAKPLFTDVLPSVKLSTFLELSFWLPLRGLFCIVCGIGVFAVGAAFGMMKGIFLYQPAKLLDG